ncbi:MAG: hypothetical protein NTV22_16555 [bacterium]|nr:hypothetical protein [bacterium]
MRITRHAALLIALVCILLPLPCRATLTRCSTCKSNCQLLEMAALLAQQKGVTNITNLNLLAPAYILKMPVCPVGGTYVLGTNGTVECTIPAELHRFRPFKGALLVIVIIMAFGLLIPLVRLWRGNCDAQRAASLTSWLAVASACLGVMPAVLTGLMIVVPWHKLIDATVLNQVVRVRLSDSVGWGLLGFMLLSSTFGIVYGHAARSSLTKLTSRKMLVVALVGLLLNYSFLAVLVWLSCTSIRY